MARPFRTQVLEIRGPHFGHHARIGIGRRAAAGRHAVDHRLRVIGPVSYTHLDVYKRQPYAGRRPGGMPPVQIVRGIGGRGDRRHQAPAGQIQRQTGKVTH